MSEMILYDRFFSSKCFIIQSERYLDEWEIAVIDLFLNAANSFGLPKSYGQIYGLLFAGINPSPWMK